MIVEGSWHPREVAGRNRDVGVGSGTFDLSYLMITLILKISGSSDGVYCDMFLYLKLK